MQRNAVTLIWVHVHEHKLVGRKCQATNTYGMGWHKIGLRRISLESRGGVSDFGVRRNVERRIMLAWPQVKGSKAN